MTTRVIIGILGVAALLFAACGDDDGASVTNLGDGSSSGSSSGSSTGSGSGSGSGVAAADKPCEPVGADLEDEADQTVAVSLIDYAFDPAAITVDAGTVTFETTNDGEEAHEFALLPGGGPVPLTDDGAPDEDALGDAEAVELEAYGPGQSCNATFELEAGDYTLFCIVETADGTTHYDLGMEGVLTVE